MTTSLITGANRGIGLELARQLKVRGEHVLAVCRTSSPELDALGVRVESGIDVASDAAVPLLSKCVADTRIDCVIANAGILAADSLDHLEFEQLRRQFEVNALGALRTVSAVLPQLKSGS